LDKSDIVIGYWTHKLLIYGLYLIPNAIKSEFLINKMIKTRIALKRKIERE
jgi:hypothetical protein